MATVRESVATACCTTNAQIVRESLAIASCASLSSILGALLVILIPRSSLKPWLYGLLKSILAGAVAVVIICDMGITETSLSSWASGLGSGATLLFVGPLTLNPPSGPNKMHPRDENLTKDELHELQKREFDSPDVRKRAIYGGIVVAVAVGLRNLACGVWFFSFLKWRRAELEYPSILIWCATESADLGAAVALPIYFGTKSRWRTMVAVVVSAAAFPLGQYLAAFTLPSLSFRSRMLEFQAGSMWTMVVYWMQSCSLETTPWRHCMVAFYAGFVCMLGIGFQQYQWGLIGLQHLKQVF
ncbi:hypothetical protein KC19_1G319600 [Ceratodon purpureus]|uniref:Uncharacterized protein n=1 Tax=Ceratodon purpureus TaxID=3225 RepID=A0A8T0JDZ1_CERPU|nr:hypothetical protein KC19_1G319600 [Ceratodon purpureus]